MSEEYGPNWVRVELMVLESQRGNLTMHAIGGDRDPGEGDTPYHGLELIKSRIEVLEAEVRALRRLAEPCKCHERVIGMCIPCAMRDQFAGGDSAVAISHDFPPTDSDGGTG